MKTTIPTTLFLLSSLLAHADIVYNVTFEDPPHVVGQSPATGVGTDRPVPTADEWEIRDDIVGFGSQVALLPDWGTPGGAMGFAPGTTYDSGLHLFSWDLSIISEDSTESLQLNTVIGGGGGTGIDLSINLLLFNHSITVYDPPGGTGDDVVTGNWAVGEVLHIAALVNLDTDTYDFILNGTQVITGDSMETGASISSVVFQRPFSTAEIALDNFRWEVVPEPSSILFLLCGGCILMGWRRRHAGA